jgi:hypothetical protein
MRRWGITVTGRRTVNPFCDEYSYCVLVLASGTNEKYLIMYVFPGPAALYSQLLRKSTQQPLGKFTVNDAMTFETVCSQDPAWCDPKRQKLNQVKVAGTSCSSHSEYDEVLLLLQVRQSVAALGSSGAPWGFDFECELNPQRTLANGRTFFVATLKSAKISPCPCSHTESWWHCTF